MLALALRHKALAAYWRDKRNPKYKRKIASHEWCIINWFLHGATEKVD